MEHNHSPYEARSRVELTANLLKTYGVRDIGHEDIITNPNSDREIALGHIVFGNPFYNKSIGQFMDFTKNQSVAFRSPIDRSKIETNPALMNLPGTRALVEAYAENAENNLLVYHKDQAEPTVTPIENLVAGIKSGEIENLARLEYTTTTVCIALKNALARAKEIEAKNVINYDLNQELQDIFIALDVIKNSPQAQDVFERLEKASVKIK
jgi:hypothetical protein